MKAFTFVRPDTVADVVEALEGRSVLLKANGIDVLDRLKERVDEPATVVGLLDVPDIDGITLDEDGHLRIGAMATLRQVSENQLVQSYVPSLAHAAGQAASPALRQRATVGGNLAQHTRCGYYRHASFPCLKRGGDVCPVRGKGGVQDTAGIFGNSTCASAHPSSLAPVFTSLDATLEVQGPDGLREIGIDEFWQTPEAGRASDNTLGPRDVIVALRLPPHATPQQMGYEEVRQKAAFDWALASCAVRVSLEAGKVAEARIVLGSLAPTPHRAHAAEKALIGKSFTDEAIRAAGEAAIEGATPLPGTRYKLQLAKVVVRRALTAARESN